ncbi:acyltransferase [Corallococcus praedator]|uniref:Acyltransferase n=1 Tax=Corallococcus praedator TaxID=2316724 RepID=A0ABX9QQ92_9BACT|nr:MULTISPECIES: acyltransferase [Corallococcus]RKH35271.1 acyltransferase [Corallococcus sp. CA031C]RKI16397.1 acyltransferase [Corallococcus praedator]
MPSTSPTLRQCLDGRRNNLDFIRFVAAVGVIFSHAFPLGQGAGTPEPFEALTHGQMTLGRLCVAVFLLISGVLITQSYERSPSMARYLWARALRIFPGLACVLLATVFLLGPALTELPLAGYFQSPETYLYLLRNLALYQPQWNLPGVFHGNAYPDAVNGSLWTLLYEVGFYLLVAGLGVVGLLRRQVALVAWAVAALVPFVPRVGPRLNLWPELYLYFGGGLLLYLFRERLRMSPWLALGCVGVLVATARWGGLKYAVGSCGTYLVLYLAFLPSRLSSFARHGDFSYGVYVYAFPVQQTVTWLMGGSVAWWVNATLSLPVVVLLAALSWHLVEKRALRLKNSPPVFGFMARFSFGSFRRRG